jgi:hypothetical protein
LIFEFRKIRDQFVEKVFGFSTVYATGKTKLSPAAWPDALLAQPQGKRDLRAFCVSATQGRLLKWWFFEIKRT